MSSFLKDILIVADEKEKTNLPEKIDVIKKEITKLKSIINEFMKDKYVELEPYIKPDEILIDKSEMLVQDMKNLQSRINDQVNAKLTSSSKELQSLSEELMEYNYSLNLSSQLLEINNCFEAIENFKTSNKQYVITALTLMKLNIMIEKNLDIQPLNIYKPLYDEYCRINSEFIEEITALWHEKVCWNEGDEPSNAKSISLQIQCKSTELTDLVQALYCMNKLTRCIESLTTKVLRLLINPIIHYECSIENANNIFRLEILNKKQTPKYKAVLNNLQSLFQFLHQHFDISIEEAENFLTRLSMLMLEEFSQVLAKDCISKIIPTSTSELESFESIVEEIEEFQNYLIEIKFINEEQKFLSKYTKNVDELYIDKKCEKLLEAARNIMKKDLHDSFKCKSENNKKFDNDEFTIENDNVVVNRRLGSHIFHLPECQISKSAQEVLHLVEEILEEACNSSDKYAIRLFYTSRNIFEMYAALVPEIHKSFLQTIPQQVALFHNNCIYLAHHLLTLAFKYKIKMPNLSQKYSIMYIDQVILLRQVGNEYFLKHTKYQQDIIFDILRESALSSIGQMPQLPPTTERAIRQCIRQLELLKTVWIEILPNEVYCRALSNIVDDMVDDICAKIISVEDIPCDVATELVNLFNVVVKRIPQIFLDPDLIEQHVYKWRRLKELIIILGASLKEIEDRWADGKGPLANEFTPQQVKQLIRALFQNTDRRSNLLSKIREK